jgi:hypothetical protein
VDKSWMNPSRWFQDSTRTVDRDQLGRQDHFDVSGFGRWKCRPKPLVSHIPES